MSNDIIECQSLDLIMMSRGRIQLLPSIIGLIRIKSVSSLLGKLFGLVIYVIKEDDMAVE